MDIIDNIETVIYAEGEEDKYGHKGYIFDHLPRKVMYLNGQFHSFNDKPAVVNICTETYYGVEYEYYFKKGKLHRDEQPAIVIYSMYEDNKYHPCNYGHEIFYINEGKLHSPVNHISGQLYPAYTFDYYLGVTSKSYYINGLHVDIHGNKKENDYILTEALNDELMSALITLPNVN